MNLTLQTETILSRLSKVRPSGQNHWMACCPAHEDHDPSLFITLKEDIILLRCFAGCQFEDIVDVLGMEEKDFFADGSTRPARKGNGKGKRSELDAIMMQIYQNQARSGECSADDYASAKKAFERLQRLEAVCPNDEPIASHLLNVPGTLGLAVNYILETAAKPQPLFAVQGALALGALACGRRYRSENNNFTNLWFAIVGPSGCGKEHIKAAIDRVMQVVGLDEAINHGGYTSPGAITSLLKEYPNHLSIMDELGKYLAASTSEHAPPYVKLMVKELMELYGRSGSVYKAQQYSTVKMDKDQAHDMKVKVRHPCISLFGMTTPEPFYSGLSVRAIKDGFLPRFIVREAPSEIPYGFRHKLHLINPPPDLMGWIKDAKSNFNTPADLEIGDEKLVTVSIENPAWEKFEETERDIISLRNDHPDISELFNRTLENSMRLAVIVAASINPHSPIIDCEAASWATEYMMDTALRLKDVTERFGRSSEWADAQDLILRFIRKYPQGINKRYLHQCCRAFRNPRPIDKKAMLTDLLNSGWVEIHSTRKPGGESYVIQACHE